MLQEVLKQATALQHQELEQLMLVDNIMDGTLSFDQYKRIISTNYIIHACFEHQIFESLGQDMKLELNISDRAKLPALLKDLEELNIDPTQFLYPETAFDFTSNAAALGALYVLEGATLGGNMIVKKLKVNKNLDKHLLNFNYYQVYGANLIANWKNFCQLLNTKIPLNEHETSIKSALKLFEYFNWVHHNSFTKTSVPQL